VREDDASQTADAAAHESGLRFVAFIFRFRMLGAALSFLGIAVVLRELEAPAWQWVALVANALLWPPLAWWIASRRAAPRQAELRNLGLDSVFGGAWIALMHFSPLPSAVLLSILSMDKVAVGSWRLMRRMSLLLVLSCLLVGLSEGFHLRLETSTAMVLASLPFLFIYPSAIAAVTYALSRRVVQQNRLLQSLNRTDPLTGLPNRMHWQDAAYTELRRCRRRPEAAALLMMDIDGFKGVNDRCGHQVGDAVIRRFADILRANCRDIDTPGRYGGEEFGLVLAGADAGTALRVAERIRAAFADSTFDDRALRCTVSVGVCALDGSIDDVDAWVRAADAALYRAKQAGRNRVELVAPRQT
jgi:diguanylate cyclase